MRNEVTNIVWLSFGEYRGYWFSALGAHTVAGYLETVLPSTLSQKIWYYEENGLPVLKRNIALFAPDYICFSVNIGYESKAMDVANELCGALGTPSGSGFVFGNRACSNLEWVHEILRQFPQAVVVDGDGELALSGLLQGTLPTSLPNSWSLIDGAPIFSWHEPTPAKHLCAPTFAISVLNSTNLHLNRQVAFVETSRGCSKWPACTFCIHSCNLVAKRQKADWRAVPIEELEKSIRIVMQSHPATINFVSEDLVGPNNAVFQQFLDFLMEMRLNGTLPSTTTLYGAVKVSDIACSGDSLQIQREKKNRLVQMRQLGFRTLYVGFESGSDPQLRRYGKYTSTHDNFQAIELMREVGISIDGGFIPFDPLVTLDEVESNMRFLETAQVPKLFIFPFNSLEVIRGSGYARLLSQHIPNNIAATPRLLRIIEHVQRMLDYRLLERFLQEMRLCYFSGDATRAKQFEMLATDYGMCAIRFVQRLIDMLRSNNDETETNATVANYLIDEVKNAYRMSKLIHYF